MQRSRKIFTVILLLIAAISALPQKRAASGGKPKGECNGNYTGTITYNRTIRTHYTGNHGSSYTRVYTYQSTIVVSESAGATGSLSASYEGGLSGSFNLPGKATATMSETLNDTKISEKDDFCKLTLKGAQDKRRQRCESVYTRNNEASGSGDANVYIGIRGNTYEISIDHIKVRGQGTDDSRSHCTNTCSPVQPLNSSRSSQITDSNTNGRGGTEPIPLNPASTNRLSGTWSKTNGDETVTFTWNLARCAPALRIESLQFDHHQVPDATRWYGVDSMTGTTDGNIVRIKAKVFNAGGDTVYANVKFKEMKSGGYLPDSTVSVQVKPGEARDVEYEWDTSGYAWDDFQKPMPNREIMAEVEGDALSGPIKIMPKPVILVHGLWSNAGAWAEYPGYLREAHSFAWKGFAVGSDPENGKMSTGEHPGNYRPTNTIFQNAQELARQIKHVRKAENAWHVDIVAHSMGGLISRKYIDTFMLPVFDGKPEVKHLVMLGTPNMGSPCADLVGGVFEFFEQNEMHAMRELRPSVVADFNRTTVNRKGVKFSILAGYLLPRTCQSSMQGDGVVAIPSALYNIEDRAFAPRHHIDLTGEEDFKNFVIPRIAIGPRRSLAEGATAWFRSEGPGFGFRDASFTAMGDDTPPTEVPTTKQKVELAPGQSKEIEIPVDEGALTGVVMAASPGVTATLIDSNGAVAGKSEGGMAALKELFRTIAVERPITGGTWKLRLENIGTRNETVYVAGFGGGGSAASFRVEAGKPAAGGTIPLVAKWTENGLPMSGAKVTGTVGGRSIEFFDDGRHGDAEANDGVYAGSVSRLTAGEHSVEARGESGAIVRMAVTSVKVAGTAKPAAKPPVKKPLRKG